jgi:hypothetical protein
LPPVLRALAHANPVSYAVDLLRHALGQPAEFGGALDVAAVVGSTAVAFLVTALLFDPEQRLIGRGRGARRPSG